MDIAEPALVDARGMSLVMSINAERADKFFAGSGHTIAEVLAAANSGKPLPKFSLAMKHRANVAVKQSQAHSPNVVGKLNGNDPVSGSEFVVVSAHLDHLGVVPPGGQFSGMATQKSGHNIYNGAMDNAAGVASLIVIARWFHDTGARPKRSLIFLAVTGEEKGELGSSYFCAHPTVALDKIVADLNMDMFLPLFPLKHLQVQGLGESTVGDDARAVARDNGVEAQFDLEPGANRFIRSDQYSFIKKGIPAVAFKFGYLPNTRENKIYYDFVHTRYHATSDTTSNPDIDPAAAAQFDHIVAALALRVADAPARPAWHADSFFRRFVTPPTQNSSGR
jgi:Zn-dependent M28 family amino/carboxypeptidase